MPQRTTRMSRDCSIVLAVVLMFSLASTAGSAQAGDVPWRTDLAAAQAEARARNLPLWIQFTGPWCIYCKKMDMFTFADSAIATRATRFVPVKVRSDAREDLVLQFGVSGLPSSIILSPSGRLILGRSDGYADAATFAGALDSAWANHLADADVLAIEGVCPVRLVEGKGRVAGDPRLAVFHDGHSYRFADNAAREAFLKDPERFLPSDGGRCVVTHKDEQKETPGNPRYGATYNGRLYLFTSLDARAKFAAEPEVYSQVDIADNGACPHCKGGDGKQVTGSPKFAATHSGRRYLFPDDAHRQAFRAAPDRYLR